MPVRLKNPVVSFGKAVEHPDDAAISKHDPLPSVILFKLLLLLLVRRDLRLQRDRLGVHAHLRYFSKYNSGRRLSAHV